MLRDVSRREEGVALLIVLVTLVVLSLMFAAVISGTRNYTRETTARLAALKLRAAMDGALYATVSDLSQGGNRDALYAAHDIRIGDIVVTVAVRPEVAKIDLNYADASLLEGLLRASNVDKGLAQQITKEIVAWRSSSGDGSRGLPSGLSFHRSQTGPFETLSELGLLRHGSGDLVACLAPDITLFSHSSDVDLAFASERVRNAVNGGDPQAANPASSVVAGLAAGVTDLVEVSESARDDASGMTLSRQTVLRLSGDPYVPFYIMSNMSPAPKEDGAMTACGRVAAKVDGNGS
jgi:general secretion pathway protein K